MFAVADAWHDGTCSSREVTAATLMWGFGPTPYVPYRTGVILGGDPDGARLDIGLEPLRAAHLSDDDLRAVNVSFCRWQPAHVRGLGPAFFTKLLYFAGYRRGTGGVQPLILGKVVAQRLPDEAGPARRKTYGWRSTEWLEYLHWAAVKSQSPEYGGEPECVEMRLFADGQRNRRTRT
ncbi:MAG: hypothetical protein LC808_23320 [Actinobacteria bacterium]|nr:hypothetical protein [Actinomycetota bacterium]